MTKPQLRAHLPPMCPVYMSDETYSKPTLSWLQGKFWNWFLGWRGEMGLNNWTRKNDCDNFARAYAQAAQDCHALSQDPADSDGLAVGEFWYYRHTGGAHAIVAAVTDQGLTFLEPQNGRVIVLTPSEISSCFYARF